ncbi:MAG: HD domain-containing protein [Chloroflexota bacterium]
MEKPKWRKAVKQAMREATKQEALQRYGTAEPSFNYRWEHVKAVVKLAQKLAKLVDGDKEIAVAAAWLHDICKSEAGERHPQEGAKFARHFLPTTDFPSEKIERVAQAIHNHMGLWRDEPLTDLESMILWDADKLSKIGLTAVFHWTGDLYSKAKPRTLEDIIAFGRRSDWQSKTVASMHTEPARRAAQARLQAYNQLWDTLEAELAGHDLDFPTVIPAKAGIH